MGYSLGRKVRKKTLEIILFCNKNFSSVKEPPNEVLNM